MLIDWLFSKIGMFLFVLLLLEVLSTSYSTYDTYNIQREAEVLAKGIADDIADVARAAPQYSVAGGHSKLISLPERVHGMPYLLRVDVDEYLVEIVVLDDNRNEEISARAFLPVAGIESPVFEGFGRGKDGSRNVLIDKPLKLKVSKEASSTARNNLSISIVGG